MKDFFISYNRDDGAWAEWIAWQLEEAGYSTVIQAWDFMGNWITAMDAAMRGTSRTIAVLSPSYVEALYTQTEWANAFRLDPTGRKDLLIPVRVRPIDPDGIFAQIVYVDLVDVDEAVAVERLLQRVRGERRKPGSSPAFPATGAAGAAGTAGAHRRQVATKPAYPAFDEDTQRLVRARAALVDWRGRYSGQEEALRSAARKARTWSRALPEQFDHEVAAVADLALRAARDFRTLALKDLEFAKPYGVGIHETVFGGQALDSVASTHASHGPGRSDARKQHDEERLAHGLAVEAMPNAYGFEMIARVLESADALARFRFDALPRGFVDDSVPAPTPIGDLRLYRKLLMARIDDDPQLRLLSIDRELSTLGSFAARKLAPYPLCARVGADGSLDLVARDAEFIYRWSASGLHPAMQYPRKGTVLHAAFVSRATEAAVVVAHADATVCLLNSDGTIEPVPVQPVKSGWRSATVWADPLEPAHWRVLALNGECEPFSQSPGAPAVRRPAASLWDGALFAGAPADGVFWQGNCDVSVHDLEGLPCLLVRQMAQEGEGIHFLDPRSLAQIRQPLFVPGFVGEVLIACGRWLAVFFLQDHGTQPRIALWDLRASAIEPITRCFERNGDVYTPFVTEQSDAAFEVAFVLRRFDTDSRQWLCRFNWPAGTVDELAEYADLRLQPVTRPTTK